MKKICLLAVFLLSLLLSGSACSGPIATPIPSTPSGGITGTSTPLPAYPSAPSLGSPAAPVPGYAGAYGFGRDATPDEIAVWNIDIMPEGTGLPPGSGTPSQGTAIFAAKCAGCHGDKGQGGLPATSEVLVGTKPWFQSGNDAPVGPRTIGNYWPYATTVFDYVQRAMPFTTPGSLSNDEVYALVAWLLNQNRIIGDNDVMNAQTLPKITMPNRDGFVPDPRPWPEVQ